MIDSVMQSVWDAKDSIAAECDYTPSKLAEMLKASKFEKGVKTVDYHTNNRTKQSSVHEVSSRR
ncbi:MAG: hypothetical protein EOM20_19095 [Spartobacteria bacterium]|nr:hypothetical protein [Spartobacteria bacterium]